MLLDIAMGSSQVWPNNRVQGIHIIRRVVTLKKMLQESFSNIWYCYFVSPHPFGNSARHDRFLYHTWLHSCGSHMGGQSKRLQACTEEGLGCQHFSSLTLSVWLLCALTFSVQVTARVWRPTPHVAEQELQASSSHLDRHTEPIKGLQIYACFSFWSKGWFLNAVSKASILKAMAIYSFIFKTKRTNLFWKKKDICAPSNKWFSFNQQVAAYVGTSLEKHPRWLLMKQGERMPKVCKVTCNRQ